LTILKTKGHIWDTSASDLSVNSSQTLILKFKKICSSSEWIQDYTTAASYDLEFVIYGSPNINWNSFDNETDVSFKTYNQGTSSYDPITLNTPLTVSLVKEEAKLTISIPKDNLY